MILTITEARNKLLDLYEIYYSQDFKDYPTDYRIEIITKIRRLSLYIDRATAELFNEVCT